jgi:hypothetical protein
MPTGSSDGNYIEDVAQNPEHWIRGRNFGVHMGVRESWEIHGTWKRWPLCIDRRIVDRDETGLQVVEGRTRVGILRGRHRSGGYVAARHLTWVARSRADR